VEDEFSVSIQQKILRAMIEEVAFAISTNESRPVHTGSLFEITDQGLTMVAVDGFRLAIRREPLERAEGGTFSFVAPGSALNEVKSICADTEDLAAVTLGKRHILFEVNETELICRRLEGEFLDYKNAIPRKNPITVIADTKSLIDSIDRVSVVISDKLKSPVRCVFDHDKVLLSAKTGNGEAKDICRLSGDGNGLEIGFNNRYLMEALRYAPADTVKIELNTGVSPAIIVPTEGEENFLYMVLPVRLKSNE
jgi:DNA polymerase-3 subunit beta